MSKVIVSCLVLVLFCIGAVFLQKWLCKRPQRCAGLVLPILCFVLSFVPVISVSVFSFVKTESVVEVPDNGGEAVTTEEIVTKGENESIGGILVGMIPIFLVMNIPTFILYMIYSTERRRQKENQELKKMNIMDL